MLNCIGRETGHALGFTDKKWLQENKVCLFLFIPILLFRFMDLFEYDKKAKEILNKYFSEPGKSEFKVSIFIPLSVKERNKLISEFTKEVTPHYNQICNKETWAHEALEKLKEEFE